MVCENQGFVMILVDTSVWIDFFVGKETEEIKMLEYFIEEQKDLAICGVIMTEVLQGIRNDREYQETKRVLSKLLYLSMDEKIFVESADLYRKLRRNGLTIRSTIDCLIASLCIDHGAHLLHRDRDFGFIGRHSSLKVVENWDYLHKCF